jgi:hypothetical protein
VARQRPEGVRLLGQCPASSLSHVERWPDRATRPANRHLQFYSATPAAGLLAVQWQGVLVWWSFNPRANLPEFVEASLRRFVSALGIDHSAGP